MHDWMLLIYSLPSQPSRKRAYVWRELKKLGAVYLRDGVALLPRREDLEGHLREVAERIMQEEGSADLLLGPHFLAEREEELMGRFNEERAAEYREIYHAGVRFLRDVLEDVDADEFGFPDVDKLESEFARLSRWQTQVRERDYFGEQTAERVDEILAKCERAFDKFVSEASERETVSARRQPRDDVFDRLAGAAGDDRNDLPL